jgi:hypothetical protein
VARWSDDGDLLFALCEISAHPGLGPNALP